MTTHLLASESSDIAQWIGVGIALALAGALLVRRFVIKPLARQSVDAQGECGESQCGCG